MIRVLLLTYFFIFAVVACLTNKLEEEKSKGGNLLHPRCRDVLSQRAELFRLAGASSAKLESIQDIVISVKESPSRNYLMIVAISLVGCIFIFGKSDITRINGFVI